MIRIRKSLFTLALSLVSIFASAQIGAGQWKIHPFFISNNITNCVETDTKVYYLVSGSLFCYDKESHTNTSLNALGEINSGNITQIYYNSDKGYLFIAYDDTNIDVIKDDGQVVNISALKDVVLLGTRQKTINDITFGDGRTYVATSFGYIMIEDETFRVTEVRVFNATVGSVAQVGAYKIMAISSKFYYCGANEMVETAGKHKQTANSLGAGLIYPINNNRFFFTTASALYVVNMTENSDGTLTFTPTLVVDEIPSVVQQCPQGFVASHFYYYTSGAYGVKIKNFRDYYYTFDSNGDNATRCTGEGVHTTQVNGSWWIMSSNGLAHEVNGAMVGDYVLSNGISISKTPYWSTFDPYLNRVLLCSTAENRVLTHYDATALTEINSYDGSQWRNITPELDGSYGSNYWIVVSPNEPDTYFFCFRKTGGVAKVKNGQIVTRYTNLNGPVSERMVALRFDSQGNLWMAQPRSETTDVVAITPQNQLLTEVNASNFITNNLNGAVYTGPDGGSKRSTFDIGAGDTKVFSSGDYAAPLIIWNNNADLSLKQYRVFNSFNDQNNQHYSTYGWVYIKADKNGRIWIGTVSGIISFDPREAFNDDFRITRNKVLMNEGKATNESLLEGTQVNCIDVDTQNRKWVATNTDGIYLVSEDGSEIIKHFNMANSPLPSDQIYSVSYNGANNSVLVVTARGVLEYFCDITPSATDYSNVIAYPNPVQSSFTGYVTIKGLMSNSRVIITDAAGNKVANLTSTGGVAMWDVCNTSGVPVKTGVYKVFAKQNSNPSTTGKPLTKIAVIK